MEPIGETLTLPPDLRAEVEAAAQDEHRPAADLLRELVERGLDYRRRRSALLASLDEAQASIARGEGIEITEESVRRLVADVKQRGRARLAAETAKQR